MSALSPEDAAAVDRVLELLDERAEVERDWRWSRTVGSWVRALKEPPQLKVEPPTRPTRSA